MEGGVSHGEAKARNTSYYSQIFEGSSIRSTQRFSVSFKGREEGSQGIG